MSSSHSKTYRRPSMTHLYEKLHSQPDDSFDWLAAAASHFPADEKSADGDVTLPVSAPSPFTVSSGSSSAPSAPSHVPDHTGSDSGSDDDNSDSDADSDVEPITLDHDTYVVVNGRAYSSKSLPRNDVGDAPFMHSAPPNSPSESARLSEVVPEPGAARTRTVTPPCSSGVPPSTIAQPTLFRRCRRRPNISHSSITEAESHQDGVCESDGDATDDEYIPSPPLNPRKRIRSHSSSSQFQKQTPSPPPIPKASSTCNNRVSKRPRLPSRSRNKQVSSSVAIRLAACIKSPRPSGETKPICPVCAWCQCKKGRDQDFKRHLSSHIRQINEEQEKGWWCKGVPVADAAIYSVPEGARPYTFLNQWMIGGCGRSFSREDALKRHLFNRNVRCVGWELIAAK